jgi:hypothetical protein
MSCVKTPLAILGHFMNAMCSVRAASNKFIHKIVTSIPADNFIKRVNFSFSSFTLILRYIVVIRLLHFAIYLHNISVIVDFINIPHIQSV